MRRDELLQGDKGGGFRGRQPNACFLDAAICAGLRPADVLVYVKRSQGRENRPYKKRSTVDAKSDAFCKSCSAPKRQTKSLRYHCTTVAHSSNRLRSESDSAADIPHGAAYRITGIIFIFFAGEILDRGVYFPFRRQKRFKRHGKTRIEDEAVADFPQIGALGT